MTGSIAERRTAVYRFFDSEDHLLYVGIAVNPLSRWDAHSTKKTWWQEVARTTVEWFDQRVDAEVAEAVAIDEEHPIHNVVRHPYFVTMRASEPAPTSSNASSPAADPKAMTRLRAAAAEVNRHDAEREELAAAIVEALTVGWRPSEVDAEVPYDRNHIRRIAKKAGVPALRDPTGKPRHDAT